ncbi:MAG TPA: hypothetical protein VFO00_04600 [Vitreimonas sp.]|nr:hypothetical protein [Vitreimonas sp.]
MKRRRQQSEHLGQDHAAALEKARMWGKRATSAHEQGRKADAGRCEDKVRDWASRARQIERSQKGDQ